MPSEELDEVTLHRTNEQAHAEIAPHTCGFCQKIVIGIDRDKIVIHEYGIKDGKVITVADCLQAAEDGCALFNSLSTAPWASAIFRGQRLRDRSKSRRETTWTTRFRRNTWGPVLYYHPLFTEGFQLYLPLPGQETIRPDLVTGCEDSRLLLDVSPPNLVPDSLLSRRRALKWFRHCERNHAKCQEYQQTFAPKRLLELSDDGQMARIRENLKSILYVTLSYCWGGDQQVKAMKTTIQALCEFFDIAQLPKSIQDGAKVAFNLGFRHIWVDALCIVQDDERDVADQITQMHKIYGGSALTITASSASTSSEGFLQPRKLYTPTLLAVRSGSGTLFPALAVPRDTTKWYNPNPLFSRAWTFQENQVSPRVLSFGSRTMAFFCLEAEQLDGGNPKVDFDSYSGEDAAMTGFINPGMKSLTPSKHPMAWTELVSMYSSLEMSVPSDKLPALAALAEEYRRRMPVTTYLAGLWLEGIHWQLLWSREDDENPWSRPPVYCGPSWSWSSVVGGAWFSHGYKQVSDLECLCIIEAASTQLQPGSHAFGRVDDGRLTVTGRVRDLIWFNREIKGGQLRARTSYARASDGRPYPFGRGIADCRLQVIIDVQSEWSPETDFTLSAIEVFRYRDNFSEDFDRRYTRALLLQKREDVEGNDTYCRVGVLLVDTETGKGEDWFDEGAIEMTVTII